MPLLLVAAIVAVIVVRRRARRERDRGPAPDAFGAAVEAERDAMRGDGQTGERPVRTPGA